MDNMYKGTTNGTGDIVISFSERCSGFSFVMTNSMTGSPWTWIYYYKQKSIKTHQKYEGFEAKEIT